MENFNLKKYLAENKLIKEEYNFKAMEDDLASKEMVKQELMDMRVNILRIMKSLKNYGYSKEEVLAFFDNERDDNIKSTFFYIPSPQSYTNKIK
tara:strand:- start:414 stop:695 length:282 start_codon:yes stop_codon:yes gene_type:complete